MTREEQVVALWELLDEIDTLDDACRGDDRLFRDSARSVQRKRFEIVSGDEFDRLPHSPPKKDRAG